MEWSGKAPRALTFLVVSIAFVTASAAAVTEVEAVRLFLQSSPRADRGALAERSVRARLQAEARIANPEIAYQLEEAADVRDEFLTLQLELPISGRRGLLADRAEVAASAAALGAEGDLQADVYEIKLTFHEVLYRERILATLQENRSLLADTVEILERREREGESSGYDLLRAERELTELEMAIAETEAAVSAARSRFGSFFDPDLNMQSALLEGDLTPTSPIPELPLAIGTAMEKRLDLRSLAAERESLELERKAAHRRRFPEPVLTAGGKRTEAPGLADTGYVVALSLPLPIFDRGHLDYARASAEGARVELDTEILARRIRADVQAALAREEAARTVAERYGQDITERAEELSRIARLQYDEGETGILELLDAHRLSLTAQIRALAARYEAKVAEIDRNRVIGNEVRP